MNDEVLINRDKLHKILIHRRNILETITYAQAAKEVGHNNARGLGRGATTAAAAYYQKTGDADLFRWLVSAETGEPSDGFYGWRESIGLPLLRGRKP